MVTETASFCTEPFATRPLPAHNTGQNSKLSVHENGKEGKSKMIAYCGFLENEQSQFSKEEL